MKINVSHYLRQQPRFHILVLCVALVVLVAVLERMFEGDVSLAVAYLIPVSLAAIPLGRWGGITISLASAITVVVAAVMDIGWKLPPITVYINAGTVLVSLVFITLLLASVKLAFTEEWKQARTDQLTGVANLSYALEMAGSALHEARVSSAMITVAALTLDNLKQVSAEKGTKVGDAILSNTGDLLNRVLRSKGFAGRHDSNRFILVLPEAGTKASGQMFKKLEQHLVMLIKRQKWPVNFTLAAITFVLLPADVEEMRDQVFKLADSAATPGKHSIEHTIVMRKDEMSAVEAMF
jgi:diguanylate cyclase (GGDEF)-like protein